MPLFFYDGGLQTVEAARLRGEGWGWIMFREILPNLWAPILVYVTILLPTYIAAEATLSFLGVGLLPPTPSWGTMVDAGRGNLLDAWWLSTFPGLAIVLTVMAFNALGDGLRDALDPRQLPPS